MTTAQSTREEIFIPFAKNKILIGCISFFSILWTILAIKPLWRPQWLLENYLIFVFVPFLVLTYKKYRLSQLSYIILTIYLTFHIFGAHYGYSDVPFGYWLKNNFGFDRNPYDRIVHFLFGFMFIYPLRESLIHHFKLPKYLANYIPCEFILAFSAIYEIIEAATAWLYSAKEYNAFVGMQGDIWDAQKDMLVAFTGSVMSIIMIYFFEKRKRVV